MPHEDDLANDDDVPADIVIAMKEILSAEIP